MIFAFAAIASLLIGPVPVAGSATGIADGSATTLTQAVPSIFSLHDPCSEPPSNPFSVTLFAGQDTDIGEVEVWEDGGNLCVRYLLHGWCLLDTHLALGDSIDDIPTNKPGSPKIGQFPNSASHDCVSEYTYSIYGACDGGTVVVAAHAVVTELVTLNSLEASLPDTVTMIPQGVPGTTCPGVPSYWDVTITGSTNSEYPFPNGCYDDFCIDTENQMASSVTYNNVKVYSSYESPLPSLAQNLDKVNYIINNYYGNQDYCAIQIAIWEVVGQTPSACSPSADTGLVTTIVDDANANGVGFVPSCGENVAIILEPDGDVQLTFAIINITECQTTTGTATAWGNGTDFDGGSWATYFTYDECEDGGRLLLRGGH